MKRQIRSLKPNVTREEAIRQFSARSLAGCLRRLTLGPLRSVADFYVPFRIFEVIIESDRKRTARTIALEAVTGALDIYCLDPIPIATVELETRNSAAPRLNSRDATQMVVDKIRRVLFSRGFLRLRQLRIGATEIGELYVPFWVGFHGRGPLVHLSVIDAVRRTPEGAAARRLIENYLVSTSQIS
jgi:hypothetical protein